MAEKQPYFLDVDTGIDDAVALALAVASPEIELLAVSTLAGNVDVVRATDNTRRVLSWLKAPTVPVHRGASKPLVKTHQDAVHAHGHNGLGNSYFPEATGGVGKDRGPASLIRHAMERPGEITLVCTGPLTNLAIALNVEPSIAVLLRRLVIMGGAFDVKGNTSEFAEFNIYVDPDAAAQVFAAPFSDVTVVGLDASHQAILTRVDWQRARGKGSRGAELLSQVYTSSFTTRGKSESYLHDPLTLAIALDSSLATYVAGTVTVELDGEKRGQTRLGKGSPGARVAKEVDALRFMEMLTERLEFDAS